LKKQLEKNLLERDLNYVVKELSASYEEISLLYRLSETLSGLSVEEICDKVVDEAISEVNVQTAVIFFINEKNNELYTESYRGKWDKSIRFDKYFPIIADVLRQQTRRTYCQELSEKDKALFPDVNTILIFPLRGKKKNIGALTLFDKRKCKEILSNNLKLLNAISFQATLAIENAFLYKELEELLLGTIKSFLKVLEASSQWTAGHTERVSRYSLAIAQEMGIDSDTLKRLQMCALLHDLGKIATPFEILNKTESLKEEEILEIQRHPLVGGEILESIKSIGDIVLGIKYHHEHWNGKNGFFGLKGDQIPLMARILAVADTYDAITSDRPYRSKTSPHDAAKEILKNSGTQFDPEVVNAFMRCFNLNKLNYNSSDNTNNGHGKDIVNNIDK
jgi:putative nucleotidyltransferase with HDIG domain